MAIDFKIVSWEEEVNNDRVYRDPETGIDYPYPPSTVRRSAKVYFVRCPTCWFSEIDPTSSDARVVAASKALRDFWDAADVSWPEPPKHSVGSSADVAGCFMWIPVAIVTGLVMMMGFLFALLSVAWSNMSIVFGLLTVISMLLFVVGVFATIVLAIRGIQGTPEERKRFQDELDTLGRIEQEHERRVEQTRKKREALEATEEYQFLKNQVDFERQNLDSNLGFRCRKCGLSFTHSISEIPDGHRDDCELYIKT